MQPKDKLILEFWDRSKELTIKNKQYRNFVYDFYNLMLKYDIKRGDITTNTIINQNKKIKACIIAKEDGIIAGTEELLFFNRDLKIKSLKKDGERVKNNETILEINGNASKILQKERINLNLLQRMSGIGTLTYSMQKKSKIRIAATRKTLWGLLDKKAVSIGGGLTHRLNLSDGIIIKDNHLKLVKYDFEKVISSVKNKSRYIEIEVENKNQALSAAMAIKKLIKKNNENLYAIMLDKIKPENIKSIIRNLKNQDLYDHVLLEASGNINQKNLHEYSNCGVDVISMGFITNSAKFLDISMEII